MTVKKFVKKPVVVEAMQYTDHPAPILDWLGNALCQLDDSGLVIQTTGGAARVFSGDWIIKGAHGEMCPPCPSDTFKTTYEPVDD